MLTTPDLRWNTVPCVQFAPGGQGGRGQTNITQYNLLIKINKRLDIGLFCSLEHVFDGEKHYVKINDIS